MRNVPPALHAQSRGVTLTKAGSSTVVDFPPKFAVAFHELSHCASSRDSDGFT